MLTDEDIKKLVQVFATREEIVTKKDFDELKNDFNEMQIAVDSYNVKADKYFQEMLMMANKIDRHERWVAYGG